MNELLNPSIARIWTSNKEDGIIVGAGFLVGKCHILTCAHVVTQALGLPETTMDTPQGIVWLDFPLLPRKDRISAKVIQWHPLLSDGNGDIAGLELSENPPADAKSGRLFPANAVWGHSFYAFGFPPMQDNGVWARGQLLGRQAMNWIIVEGMKAQGYAIEQGFSGTPVWDDHIQGVVGMVVATSQPADLKTAFVIPTEVLLETWPLIGTSEVEPRNPYKGLHPFRKEDAGDFFGREQLINDLVLAVGRLASEQSISPYKRLLAIIGPSGSGKSSVIMAGLLPRLQNGALPGSEEWTYLEPMMPGKHPLEALILTLAVHFPERSSPSLREELEDHTIRGLHMLAARTVRKPGSKMVLFIDQFEELFTQTASEEERQYFIKLLLAAISELRGPLVVLLTMRADFYDRPMQYPKFAQLIQQQQHLVLAMDMTDLRNIIEQPAALSDVQVTFENGLVDELLFEMRDQIGALPLLQFTLTQLFEMHIEHQLNIQAYNDIGGVKGALTKHAEKTYASLPSEEYRRLARTLFVRLIDLGTTQQDTTRRRALLSEFLLSDPAQTRLLQETMDVFVTERLLTTNEVGGITTIEVSHEALIREWTRLSEWLQEVREDFPLQQILSKDVTAWEQLDKPKDRLYRGSQLKEARIWTTRNIPNQREVLFLHTSSVYQWRQRVNMIATILVSIMIAGVLASVLLFLRPSWCPSYICPAPQALLKKDSAHDKNLEVSFQTLQSSFYMIPSDSSLYTLNDLPRSVSAQLIDHDTLRPYRVVVGVHSLQQGRFGLSIEQIALVIRQIHLIPYPLHVWIEESGLNFNSNPYKVTYHGGNVGDLLPAIYVPTPIAHVQLQPGESDDLDIQVSSHAVRDIHFQVQITYRVVNESQLHILTLPNIFEVLFSDTFNWHLYRLQAGHLVPSGSTGN